MSNTQKQNNRKWLVLVNIPVQMAVIILVFSWLGEYLDENHSSPKIYYSKLLTLIGVFLSIYNVIRQVIDLNKNS